MLAASVPAGRTRLRILVILCASFAFAACGSKPSTPATLPATAFEDKLVRRPGSTPEDSKVYIVQGGRKRWVVNASWFAAHGHKFPDEVQQISASQLDEIPTGEPIQ